MVKALGIIFNQEQRDFIYNYFCFNKDGLLKNTDVNEMLIQILMGHVFFADAAKKRQDRANHHLDMATTMVASFELFETLNQIYALIKEKDPENYGSVKVEEFNQLMATFDTEENGFMQRKDSDPEDMVKEFDQIMEILRTNHVKDGEFFYTNQDKHGLNRFIHDIIDFKAGVLSTGLIDNDRGKLELYLMEFFEKLDIDKVGHLTEEQLFDALEACPIFKLILTEVKYKAYIFRESYYHSWFLNAKTATLTTKKILLISQSTFTSFLTKKTSTEGYFTL